MPYIDSYVSKHIQMIVNHFQDPFEIHRHSLHRSGYAAFLWCYKLYLNLTNSKQKFNFSRQSKYACRIVQTILSNFETPNSLRINSKSNFFFSRQSNNKFQDTVKHGSVQIDTQYEPTYNTLILHNISELPVQIELILSGVNDDS